MWQVCLTWRVWGCVSYTRRWHLRPGKRYAECPHRPHRLDIPPTHPPPPPSSVALEPGSDHPAQPRSYIHTLETQLTCRGHSTVDSLKDVIVSDVTLLQRCWSVLRRCDWTVCVCTWRSWYHWTPFHWVEDPHLGRTWWSHQVKQRERGELSPSAGGKTYLNTWTHTKAKLKESVIRCMFT